MGDPNTLWDFLPYLAAGIPVTLSITFVAMAFAIPVAFLLALGRMSDQAALRWAAGFVIELFRGSSAIVQLFWVFYVLPFMGIDLPALVAAVFVLSVNSGAFLSEVVRAGLVAVPVGQYEASLTLGFSKPYRFFRIILPQALPLMIPPFGNALVTMLKFTALVSLVTIQDLAYRASLVGGVLGESGLVFGIVIVVYFSISLVLGGGARLLERVVNRRAGRIATADNQHRIPDWALGLNR